MIPRGVIIMCAIYLTTITTSVKSANILAVSLMGSHSHHIWNRQLALGLVEREHNVTMITHNFEKNIVENFTVITIPGLYDILDEMKTGPDDFYTFYYWDSTKMLFYYYDMLCQFDIERGKDQLELLLNYPKTLKFDLILWDVNSHQCLYPLVEKLGNPPVVGLSAYGFQPYMYAYEHHYHPSYIPTSSLPYTSKMSYLQRLDNTATAWLLSLYRAYIYMPSQTEKAKQIFGNDIKSLEQIEEEISALLLVNNDPLLEYPQAFPPNIIPVGALQVKPAQALNKELQEIMDSAKHGVILFSLGTNVNHKTLGEETVRELLDAFSRLKETVLWKLAVKLDNVSSNVILTPWLPQNDILGHPNTKLFISHGGGLSTHETIYHGVPTVEIPFCFDQICNALRMTDKKMARSVNHKNITADIMYNEIREVLDNPMYRKNIQDLSRRFKDQPQTPLERAIFWVEYVLRHGDVKYLQLPSKNMMFCHVKSFDVILSLIIVVSVFITVVYKVCKRSCKKIFQMKKKEKVA